MNNISIASVIEKNKISSDNAAVFALTVSVVDPISYNEVDKIRLVNHTTNLMIDGYEHVCIPFDLDLKDESGEVQNVSLVVQDQADVITPYLRQYRGIVGSEILVSLVTVAPDELEAAAIDFSEVFNVVSSSSANYVVTLDLGAENPLTRTCPGRSQLRDRCSFTYLSPECGYQGELTSCDLTLMGPNGCEVHNNAKRYGGNPSITVMNV